MGARISVIVPVYKVEEYIGACVESLRAQAFRDFEVVCVNDGTPDDSFERARRAAGGDGRFVFVERPNGGLSAARNTGVEHATGDYVTFLDSDDCYAPDALQRIAEALDAHAAADLDLVDFSARTFYEDDGIRSVHEEDYYESRQPIDGVMSGPELFCAHMRQGSYVSSACMHAIRRSLLDDPDMRFCEGLLHEDELFTPLLYGHAKASAFVCEPLYLRRMRAGSIMTAQRSIANIRAEFRIVQILEGWIVAHGDAYDADFIDAFMMNIANLGYYAFGDLKIVGPEQVDAYIATLDAQDRIAFDRFIRFASVPAERDRRREVDELLASKTYRAGNLVAAIPRALARLARRG